MKPEERAAIAAAAAKHAQLDVLRKKVRASLSPMDATPCDRNANDRAEQANNELWERIERRGAPKTRSKVPARDADKRKRALGRYERRDAIASVLRGLVTCDGDTVTYNDGEQESIGDALDFLTDIVRAELKINIAHHHIADALNSLA